MTFDAEVGITFSVEVRRAFGCWSANHINRRWRAALEMPSGCLANGLKFSSSVFWIRRP